MDTPNYKESTVTGEKWTRASQVFIDNSLGFTPKIKFVETEAINIGSQVIVNRVGSLETYFDPAETLHLDIYTKLNELYVLLREARDAELQP